jgi:hypothetical protein
MLSVMPRRGRWAMLAGKANQEADMERTDWLDGGFDSAESRFLMVTAITHHRFNSAVWGEHEIRKLYAELAEIEAAGAGVIAAFRRRTPGSFSSAKPGWDSPARPLNSG